MLRVLIYFSLIKFSFTFISKINQHVSSLTSNRILIFSFIYFRFYPES